MFWGGQVELGRTRMFVFFKSDWFDRVKVQMGPWNEKTARLGSGSGTEGRDSSHKVWWE